jgi:DNA-binding transcriptional regulator YiaG
LTQEQLTKLGIDESTIAGWERGENSPVGSYRKLVEDFIASRWLPGGFCGAGLG